MAAPASAVELHIHYTAIQKAMAEQMFTSGGRFYVRGTAQSKCNHAYLENPVVGALDGRLQIRARFSGRSGANLLGFCLALGDTFEMKIWASPYVRDGFLRLGDVWVETAGKETTYASRVRAAVARDLSEKFAYNITEQARRLLEQQQGNSPYERRLEKFHVAEIRVSPQALILLLDFTLVVK